MKKDNEQNKENTSSTLENAKDGMKDAGAAMGAATMLTPKVKLAITSNELLNDPANLIDIESTPDVVSLTGHVTTPQLKELATELAAKAIKDDGQTQKVENKLEVKPKI